MASIPYRYFTHSGGQYVEAGAWPNTPYGYTEIPFELYLTMAKQKGQTDEQIQKVAPGAISDYSMWNGAFVKSSLIPELEAQGATVQNGNVVGKDVGGLGGVPMTPEQKASVATNPPTQTNAVLSSGQNYENNQALQSQDFYKVKVPITAQNPGGYDIYKKDGTKITLEAFQALKLNDKFIPDQTGVVDPGNPTGDGAGSNPGGTGVGGNPSGVTGLSSTDLDAKLTQYGINPSGLSADQKAVFGAMFAFQESQAALGQSQAINNANDFTKYYNEALTRLDPEYKAIANLGRKDFDLAVANLTGDVDFANQQRQQQQEAERNNLSERNAEAGRVYSGFAQKAKEQLATTQTGVIESSKRALKKDLFGLGSQFEQTYGSAATSPFSIAGESYSPAGNLFGSQNYSQQNAAIAEAQRKAGLLPYSQAQSQQTQNIINPVPA